MIERLAGDHKNARELAEGITGCKGISVDLQRVQTNLVTVKINHPKYHLYEFIEKLREQDVWVIPFGFDSLRMALYWEIGEEEVEATIQAFCKIANR
jgi:threonine aldolase